MLIKFLKRKWDLKIVKKLKKGIFKFYYVPDKIREV